MLVYFSYPTIGGSSEPPWVQQIAEKLETIDSSVGMYRPWFPLEKLLEVLSLEQALDCSARLEEQATFLKLPTLIFKPLKEAKPYLLGLDDAQPNTLLPFKDLYALLRATVVLVDLSGPNFGESYQDVFFAHLANIPIIGVSDKFMNAPCILEKLEVMVNSFKPETIIKQIFALSSFENSKEAIIKPDTSEPA